MRRTTYPALVVFLLFFSVSCKKGDTGPAGANGTNGTNGANGKDGNANITLINYGSQTFTGAVNYALPASITQGKIDSSLVLVYYVPSTEVQTSWYPIPGLGSGGLFDTRFFVYQSSTSPVAYSLSVRAIKPDGSGPYANPLTFTKLRVIIAPASSVVSGSRVTPDLKSYPEVKSFFNLNE